MQTLTAQKAANIIADWGITFAEADNQVFRRRFAIPDRASKQVWFCRFVAEALYPWERCLLGVTEWGIWRSSENWHLYYRLRQSYGSQSLIENEPAHLFFDFEKADLVSFIQIG